MDDALASLTGWLEGVDAAAIALSGGVDSMTLAVVAGRVLGHRAQMFHAVSPAVPADATERVRRFAARADWTLQVFDAGEFADTRYRANPVDRCYYCKSDLYGAIARQTRTCIVSGTNVDDLGDYRPGLRAAAEYEVRHPYVELDIDKQGVRGIARRLGLDELAELPAAPCLASRVETGIRIEAATLASIYAAEKLVQEELAASVVRCRVRSKGIVVELDTATLDALSQDRRERLAQRVATTFRRTGLGDHVTFRPYRMGSAFLHSQRQVPHV